MEFFSRDLLAQGIGTLRVIKYVHQHFKLRGFLGMPFEGVGKEEVKGAVIRLREEDYTAHTVQDFNWVLKEVLEVAPGDRGVSA